MLANLPQTSPDLPNPGSPPVGSKTLSRWNQFLGAIAAGEGLPDSMLKYYITRADIEACVRSDPNEYEKWNAARLAAHRKVFTVMVLEDIMAEIAGGATTQAALQHVGLDSQASSFNKLITADPEINAMFLAACKARTASMADEIIEIADDDSNDVIPGLKGDIPNNAAVNRSKLRADIRMRLMAAYHNKLYGEKSKGDVQVNVQVNHAAALEEARSRRDTRKVKVSPREIQAAVDAEFADYKSPEDESWLDAPQDNSPRETRWLSIGTTDAPPAVSDTSWLDT